MEFFFKSALRNHWRDRVFTALNVIGLSIGLGCCFFVIVYVDNEFSYDRFNENSDRIYRIIYKATSGNHYAQVPPPIQPLIAENIEECQYSSRVYSRDLGISITKNNEKLDFEEEGVLFVDSAFWNIFTIQRLQGNESDFLKDPFGVVLTRETALKYFGSENALGKVIRVAGRLNMNVIGVVEDFPDQSHLHFSMLLPYEAMFKMENDKANEFMSKNLAQNWVISHSATYMLLNKGARPKEINKKLDLLLENFAPEQLQVGQSFYVEPILDIHLLSDAHLDPEPQNDIQTLALLGLIALVTMLMATLNFISLSTAQTFRRVREVALKKAMGASRTSLTIQFMGESFLLFLAALIGGLILFALAIPSINEVMQSDLRFSFLWSPLAITGVIFLFLILSISGGIYPAIQLSSTEIVSNLKADKGWTYRTRKVPFRQFLLWVQFTISILLVSGSFLLFRQLNFMIDKPLGFETKSVMTVPIFSQNLNNIFGGVTGELRSKMNSFEEELAEISQVKGVTISSILPGLGAVSRMTDYDGKESEEVEFIPSISIDYDFLQTYEIQIIAGRDMDKGRGTDHLDAFLINETAVEYFNWGNPENAIGKMINMEGREGKVIGVYSDFYYQSLRSEIGPLIMYIGVPHFTNFSINLAGDELQGEIVKIGEIWEELFPEKVFDYRFLEDLLAEEYSSDQNLAVIVRILSLLALIVAALGSYGLIRFIARQREKEIGIRKVLGASTLSIAYLLTRGYALPFVLAMVVALPLSIILSNEVLSEYAIRVHWQFTDYALGIGITLLSVMLTIGLQTYRSSISNPADIIRDE